MLTSLFFLKNVLTDQRINRYVYQIFSYLYQPGRAITPFTGYFSRIVLKSVESLLFRYRVKLRLKGNGFYLKSENDCVFVYGGQSHLFAFQLPVNVRSEVKGRKKRLLILISSNQNDLINFASFIQKFVYPDIYRHKGLRFIKQKLRQKEGKKKFV